MNGVGYQIIDANSDALLWDGSTVMVFNVGVAASEGPEANLTLILALLGGVVVVLLLVVVALVLRSRTDEDYDDYEDDKDLVAIPRGESNVAPASRELRCAGLRSTEQGLRHRPVLRGMAPPSHRDGTGLAEFHNGDPDHDPRVLRHGMVRRPTQGLGPGESGVRCRKPLPCWIGPTSSGPMPMVAPFISTASSQASSYLVPPS